MLSLRCACYFIVSQCVKALRILSTPCSTLFLSHIFSTVFFILYFFYRIFIAYFFYRIFIAYLFYRIFYIIFVLTLFYRIFYLSRIFVSYFFHNIHKKTYFSNVFLPRCFPMHKVGCPIRDVTLRANKMLPTVFQKVNLYKNKSLPRRTKITETVVHKDNFAVSSKILHNHQNFSLCEIKKFGAE